MQRRNGTSHTIHVELLLKSNLFDYIFVLYDISIAALILSMQGSCTVALRKGRFTTPMADSRKPSVRVHNVAFARVISNAGLAIPRDIVAGMWLREGFGATFSWPDMEC
jgi:hypothetical protein